MLIRILHRGLKQIPTFRALAIPLVIEPKSLDVGSMHYTYGALLPIAGKSSYFE